jgi:hypothetical protein
MGLWADNFAQQPNVIRLRVAKSFSIRHGRASAGTSEQTFKLVDHYILEASTKPSPTFPNTVQ